MVVHNGIIENSHELKKDLLKKHKFFSETDTEVIAHLIEDKLKNNTLLKQAVIETGNLLKGRNAFVVLDSSTGKIIAFRNGSPLIVGVKYSKDSDSLKQTKEFLVASDIQAFTDKTKYVMYPDDEQVVVIDETPEFYEVGSGKKYRRD